MAKKYRRVTKKELKKDALADRGLALLFYLRKHQNIAYAVVGGIIVVLAGTTYLRRTRATHHKQVEYEFRQAVSIYGMGDMTEALTRFQDVSNLYPKTPAATNSLYWIANIYYFQGSYSEARTQFEQYLEKGKDPLLVQSTLLGIADTYLQENDTFSALQKYEQLASRFPGSALAPRALLQSLRCYKLLNQPEQARSTLEKLITTYPNSYHRREGERLIINLM